MAGSPSVTLGFIQRHANRTTKEILMSIHSLHSVLTISLFGLVCLLSACSALPAALAPATPTPAPPSASNGTYRIVVTHVNRNEQEILKHMSVKLAEGNLLVAIEIDTNDPTYTDPKKDQLAACGNVSDDSQVSWPAVAWLIHFDAQNATSGGFGTCIFAVPKTATIAHFQPKGYPEIALTSQ